MNQTTAPWVDRFGVHDKAQDFLPVTEGETP